MLGLTQETPKPMLCVHGKPILQRIIEGLLESGIRQVCIVTGFRAEVIENFFEDGSKFGAEIHYVRQMVQDGTGKAPELAKGFVGSDPFLLTYGDILVKPEVYGSMLQRFSSGAYAGVITVTPGEDVSKGGLNLFDGEFCLREVLEKPSAAKLEEYRAKGLLQPGDAVWYNAGIYIFTPALFRYTAKLQKSPRGEYELPDAINSMVKDGFKLAGLKIAGRWVDVRDPEVLASLCKGEDL
jgi:NDP-sugar pyrophosphorylase family protein